MASRPRRRLITVDEAKPSDRQHKKPCSDCPWARTALAGWLGGLTPEQWLADVHGEARIACHTLIGPQCAGAAIYRGNMCNSPRDRSLLVLPPNRDLVFANQTEFIKHHSPPEES